MRFFHLSDLHIGLKLMNRDLQEDQRYVFKQIADYAAVKRPDGILIAGDIYDRSIPSAEAVELFDHFTMELTEAAPGAEIMIISGNHDNAQRINLFRQILSRQNVHMIGLPPRTKEESIAQVTMQDDFGPVHVYLLPFVKPSMIREITGVGEDGSNLSYDAAIHRLLQREEVNTLERNILVSHQFYLPAGKSADEVERMDSELFRTVGNIDEVHADVLEPFDYAALGHIHKPMKVGGDRYRYCGTPMPCSISEEGQQKGILQVDLGAKGDVSTAVLPLIPLHEIRTAEGTAEEILSGSSQDYVRIILTDSGDLPVFDIQDRIYDRYPNVLEIRRERDHVQQSQAELSSGEDMPPLDLCREFLGEIREEQECILQQTLNEILEGGRE